MFLDLNLARVSQHASECHCNKKWICLVASRRSLRRLNDQNVREKPSRRWHGNHARLGIKKYPVPPFRPGGCWRPTDVGHCDRTDDTLFVTPRPLFQQMHQHEAVPRKPRPCLRSQRICKRVALIKTLQHNSELLESTTSKSNVIYYEQCDLCALSFPMSVASWLCNVYCSSTYMDYAKRTLCLPYGICNCWCLCRVATGLRNVMKFKELCSMLMVNQLISSSVDGVKASILEMPRQQNVFGDQVCFSNICERFKEK